MQRVVGINEHGDAGNSHRTKESCDKMNWALPTTDVRSGHTLAAHNDHQLSSSINSLSQNS
jgi:hypothetical protein